LNGGIRTQCLLRWTSGSNAWSNLDPSPPNPPDLRPPPRIEPIPAPTLPESLEESRFNSDVISADFSLRDGGPQKYLHALPDADQRNLNAFTRIAGTVETPQVANEN